MSISNSSNRSVRTIQKVVLVAVAIASTACASFSRKEKGAVIGAAAGGAVGGVIGNNTGSTARGAILGAVLGGAAGAVIGHQMDQQAKELTLEIPGAVVQRVGEGIHVTFASGLLYNFQSYAIRPEAGQNLRNLAISLQKYPNTELLIVGHSESSESNGYDQGLSSRRANSASEYLALQGVGANRIRTSGKGDLEPLASNETEAGRQMNRRIEVAIFAGEKAHPAPR